MPEPEILTLEEVLKIIEREREKAGTIKKFAEQLGCKSTSYIGAVLRRTKPPGGKILGPLGLIKIKNVGYVREAKAFRLAARVAASKLKAYSKSLEAHPAQR